MHGLDQSQALTEAARALSAAKSRYVVFREALGEANQKTQEARTQVAMRQQERDAAYKAYTNPFNIKKTV